MNMEITKRFSPYQVKSVTIIGKRWFQKTYGNTYNTVQIIVDGETVAKLPKAYGYGDYYAQRAEDWLEENGYMPGREHHENGSKEPGWRYFRDDRNIPYNYQAIDVSREKDL